MPLISYWAGTGVNIDEAEQLIYLPHFWMGYGSSQPPLYSWLSAVFCQIFGTSVLSLKIVKYLMVLLGTVCVAVGIRRLGYSRGAAAAAMLGLFTIPEILWEMQRALTHSVAALAFSAMMVLALILLFEKRTLARYAFFGLAAGLALLAKYNDILLLIALIAAALSIPVYRSAILDRRIVMSAFIAALVVLPTALWSLEHQSALLGNASKFQIGGSGTHILSARLQGLRDLVMGSISFAVLPFGLALMAFIAEKLVMKAWRHKARAEAQFVGRIILFGLAITVALIITSGASEVRNRWLLPLLFLVPAYGAMRAEEFDLKGRKIQYFLAGTGAAFAILALPATWYVQAAGGNGFSSSIRLDYPAFYKLLTADGPVSTIIGDRQWVGNFRLVERNLVIMDPQTPHFGTLMQPPAIIVWLDDRPLPAGLLSKAEKAGYALEGGVRRLSVPERLSRKGSRAAGFVRLRKINDVPAAADGPDAGPVQDGD
ncbi:MAG: glycosyltransferase family 39 protein [Hyphomicrobiales bacterium]|nr:glycosyltransferase family 39 protein [Hyphomicrobiales bacterium]